MQVLVKIGEKPFRDSSLELKKSMIMATKWYCKNILSNPSFSNTFVKYRKKKETAEIVLELYSAFETDDEKRRHCEACREWHTRVFYNEFFNCNMCNMLAFDKQVKDRLKVKQKWYKDQFDKNNIL